MKICQVVLLSTLGVAAGAVLKAQTLPAPTVLVASESMPGGAEFFPELLASSHDSLSAS